MNWHVAAALTVTTALTQTGTVGAAISAEMQAEGAGPYTWTATGLPAGLSLNASTGVISGVPSNAGTATATIQVQNSAGRNATVSMRWTIAEAITFAADPGTQHASVGVALSARRSATGGTAPFEWSVLDLPAGLTLNPSTGTVSGTPTTTGTSTATLRITDAAGATNTAAVTWSTTDPLVASSPGSQSVRLTQPVSLPMTASGGTQPYQWKATFLPAGLTIDANTGTISGTPTTVGTPYSTITVTDAAGRVAYVYVAWDVTTLVRVSPVSSRSQTVGETAETTMTADGGSGPYRWSAQDLPDGLSLNTDTGQITGTVTDITTDRKSHNVIVTATDSVGRQGSITLTWQVRRLLSVTIGPATVTATINTNEPVQGRIEVLDRTAGDAPVITCSNTASCTGRIPYKVTGTHLFIARLLDDDGTVHASSLETTATFPTAVSQQDADSALKVQYFWHSLSYPTVGAVDEVRVSAGLKGSTDNPLSINTSSRYLEIEDTATGKIYASCGNGTSCDAWIPASVATGSLRKVLATYEISPTGTQAFPPSGTRTVVWAVDVSNSIDTSAWSVKLTPSTHGDNIWRLRALSSRTTDTIINDGRMTDNRYTKLHDLTTGKDVSTCNLEEVYEANLQRYACEFKVAAANIDPTHNFVIRVHGPSAHGCHPYCENILVTSNVVTLASGMPWIDSGAFWRGGDNPIVPSAVVEASSIPAEGSDPRTVSLWWGSRNKVQKQHAINTHSERIGALDGIPVADRDQANRKLLVPARESLRQEVGRLNTQKAETADEAALEQIEIDLTRLEGLQAGITIIEARLALSTPQAYLIGFSTARRGRVVLAVNNPDYATNIATFVPGTGARLAATRGDLKRIDAMALDAKNESTNATTSTVLWLGYDAPQNIAWPKSDPASDTDFAVAAAPLLRRFQAGLRITHHATRAHHTVLGHSYGTTVVGAAARQPLDTDQIILVGSPGVGAAEADSLHLTGHTNPTDRVWATTAPNDMIQLAGVDKEYLIHGINPVSSDFRARVFASPEVTKKGSFPYSWANMAAAHSAYWDEGNPARASFARIIVGRGDQVVLMVPTGGGPI